LLSWAFFKTYSFIASFFAILTSLSFIIFNFLT
jgi:hypothetical protein